MKPLPGLPILKTNQRAIWSRPRATPRTWPSRFPTLNLQPFQAQTFEVLGQLAQTSRQTCQVSWQSLVCSLNMNDVFSKWFFCSSFCKVNPCSWDGTQLFGTSNQKPVRTPCRSRFRHFAIWDMGKAVCQAHPLDKPAVRTNRMRTLDLPKERFNSKHYTHGNPTPNS